MKRVTNKELISVILVNIGLLAAAVYMWLIYDRRQTIIKSEEPIQKYSVLEVNCRRRTSSSIFIEFNGKQYYVAVARDKCIQFDPQKIKLFYDKERDKVYEESGAMVRYLVPNFILYLCSCIWLLIVIKKDLVVVDYIIGCNNCNYTTAVYDMGDRRTEVNHPASGITTFTYDALGNVLTKQTANLAKEGKFITYDYDYQRLTGINYPDHPENNVKYYYGGRNASQNRIGRLMLREDGTGAIEYFYGKMGEVTKTRRTMIVPNQAIATYVTQ